MNLLILGRGKTGSLVAEVARERRHHVRALSAAENTRGGRRQRRGLHPRKEKSRRRNHWLVRPSAAPARDGAPRQDRLPLRIEFFHWREPVLRNRRHRRDRLEIRLQ